MEGRQANSVSIEFVIQRLQQAYEDAVMKDIRSKQSQQNSSAADSCRDLELLSGREIEMDTDASASTSRDIPRSVVLISRLKKKAQQVKKKREEERDHLRDEEASLIEKQRTIILELYLNHFNQEDILLEKRQLERENLVELEKIAQEQLEDDGERRKKIRAEEEARRVALVEKENEIQTEMEKYKKLELSQEYVNKKLELLEKQKREISQNKEID